MLPPGLPLRSLSAAELAAACSELDALREAQVLDVAPLSVPPDADDLLLVLAHASDKLFLHLAPGGNRARLTLTTARFPAAAMAQGLTRDLLRRELTAARVTAVASVPGERRATLHFATAHGPRRLVAELFGARGFWALLGDDDRILVQSRPVATAVRTLAPGDRYAPPPPSPTDRAEPAPRFTAPVLAAIDAWFRPHDEVLAQRLQLETLLRAAQRALHKATAKVQGVQQQLADVGRADALRDQANLMLAYQHTVRRGATTMQVPDPARDGELRTIELDPAVPVVPQANALYDKARRLDAGREMARTRLLAAEQEVATLTPLLATLGSLSPTTPDLELRLVPLRQALQQLGALPKPPKTGPTTGKARPDPAAAEAFRRFVSAEGYPLWVGRNNEQNDRLTMRIANGNDLWLHVGGGRPGSHVIVRLPKQKTASLETLLDAATLAVHFSKARGESRIDVIYTQKKHVRKPKGLPAGAVVPAQTKTITVLRDEARLQRLLGSGAPDSDA